MSNLGVLSSGGIISSTQVMILEGPANWKPWKEEVAEMLQKEDLWDHVSKFPQPGETDSEDFRRKDSRAKEIIVSTLSDGPRRNTVGCSTAPEMWNKLQSVFAMASEGHDPLFIELTPPNPNVWFLDTRTVHHMTCHRDWLRDYIELKRPVKIPIRTGRIEDAIGIGSIRVKMYNGSKWLDGMIEKVLYVPSFQWNFFSVTRISDKGYMVLLIDDVCTILDADGVPLVEGKLARGFYRLRLRVTRDSDCELSYNEGERKGICF